MSANKTNATKNISQGSSTLGSFTGATIGAGLGIYTGSSMPTMALPQNPIAGQNFFDGYHYYLYDGVNWINMNFTTTTAACANTPDNEDITSTLEDDVFIFNIGGAFNKSKTTTDLYNTYVEYLVSLKFYYLPFYTDIHMQNNSNFVRLKTVSKMIRFLETVTPEQKNEIKRMYEKLVMVQKLKDEKS